MIFRAFCGALWDVVRGWACRLVERVLNWTAIRLMKWSEGISEAADTVGGLA